ncbi:MAG TPA: type II secretion system F family protein [Xanthobacteraceae bacterium]|nr:type II secretion system F family protein [Xanthobacteraceae bacterium]
MPTFQYSAYGAQGELARGDIEAPSAEAASDLLFERGLSAFRMQPRQAAERWWNRELLAQRTSRTALLGFVRELATLMTAEIPLDDALRMLADPTGAAVYARLAADVRADVLNGATLSEAMQRHGHVFPTEFVSVVRASEIGGMVRQVLSDLADLLERRTELRNKVRSALVYPALLICLAIGSLTVVIGALIPSVASIFAGSGKQLPAFVSLALWMQSHWSELLTATALLVAGGIGAGWLALRRPAVRFARDRLALRLPMIGQFVRQQETARFALTLGTLLKAGVPLLQAAASAHDVVRNQQIAGDVERVVGAVREGAALHHALARETSLPQLALRMIAIGEEAGKLDRMLLRVAAIFEETTRRTVDRGMTLLAPLLTMVIAALVGGLIITVMDAIMTMNGLAF